MGNESEIQKNFGRRAAAYRHSSTHGNPEDLDRMIRLLKPSAEAVALDVATGGGHTAIKLAEHMKKVIAIDITPEMLAEAKGAALHKGLTNLEYRLANVHDLTAFECQFDIVCSRFAPHHFYNIELALKEICRVLKPGGNLYILDCSTADGEEPEKAMNLVELLRDSSHRFSYSPRLWKRLLAELPLRIEHSAIYKEKYELPEWFDRMKTEPGKRQEIFQILNHLSTGCKSCYPFDESYITTYRYEILAKKI